MFTKQDKDGNWYIYRRTSSNTRGRTHKFPRSQQISYRNWFLVKYLGKQNTATIELTKLHLPLEFIGKKIRLKIEIIPTLP